MKTMSIKNVAAIAGLLLGAESALPITLGPFTFNDLQFGNNLAESDGGTFRNANWLNIVNANPGNPGALTGANFDTWNATGSLATGRQDHTATLLQNGMVLVAGGVDSNFNVSASAELYDPASGKWTATGSLNTARYQYTATLLQNGMVLVAGGFDNITLASAELYDPERGRWTALDSLNTGRWGHTATLLQNGKLVLVAGGFDSNFNVLATAELGRRQP